MSSFSLSFVQQVNTKYEAWRLVHDPTRLFMLLYSKYGDIKEDFLSLYINQLVFNLPTKLNCFFKEIKYCNMTRDYLKRCYKTKESILRIPKLSDYYKNYHLFFCKPTLRHYQLGKIMNNFQDKKAEIFYKNNYKESKENVSLEKEENNFKKNSSISISSFDNITNNKIIFDKYTKKMLDKSETELKNNNYYNTLILETSRSHTPGNNELISKRNGDANSFEKCIHALIEYQYSKNQKIKNKRDKKVYLNNKKIKNILINYSSKCPKIKKDMSQSYRSENCTFNFNIYNKHVKLLNKAKKINSIKQSNMNINLTLKKTLKNKKKKGSLYSLTNTRYNTSSGTLISYKRNSNLNQVSSNNINNQDANINYPSSTTHKDSKKRTNFLQNSTNTNSNYSKFAQFTEYLLQSSKNKEKYLFHKKNCLSIGDSQNIFFNFVNSKNNRITKKKVTLNKNLKINTSKANYSTQNLRKTKHGKNKTFDYNTINNSNNYLKTDNIIYPEEFNNSIKKHQKKKTYIINLDNTNFKKKMNPKMSSNSKTKNNMQSPTYGKLYNKISATQTNSKEKNNKMRVKKCLPININSNVHKVDKLYPLHKKNNKSMISNDNINNTFNIVKPLYKFNKNNFCLSPHPLGKLNFNLNNINSNLSPNNKINKNIVYFKTNVNTNRIMDSNIYIKKSIHKDNNFINHLKQNTLINSCNFNTNFKRDISQNLSLSKNTNISNVNLTNSTSNDINKENIKFSRNKKLNLKAKFNYSKKSDANSKTNSTMNNNKRKELNYNLIINNDLKNNIKKNGNINISIGKSNINIKDSILHIDKVYIKKESKKKINSKFQKLYENDHYFLPKKTIEMNLDNNLIKVEINEPKMHKEIVKTMDYSQKLKGNAPNLINVHRNCKLTNNKNIKDIKRKIN